MVAAARNHNTRHDSGHAEPRTQYLWGLRYIDDLVQRQRDTDGTGLHGAELGVGYH